MTITYDALGNPLSYRGKTLTWQNGRELATVNGTTSYTYGADGIRTAKTVSGVTTTYALSGSTVLSQTTGNETLFFYYDVNGNLAQIGYKNGTAAEVFYFVTHNLQGDVTAVYNAADSTIVGTYTYDPWGRITAVTPASSASDPNGILTKNPFRYRGYYYDAETGFYYLNSRYYDPEICRFINADLLLDGRTLLGYNLFAYCVNDPVNLVDRQGEFAITATVVSVAVLLGGLALIGAVAANDPSVQTAVADMAKDIRNGAKNVLAQLCGSTPASPPGPNRDDDNYTKHNFRKNLQELTGQSGKGKEAHHVFPQKFINQFQEAGINIHDPHYGSWVDPVAHHHWSYQYNQQWFHFFECTLNPSVEQIKAFACELAIEFEFTLNF